MKSLILTRALIFAVATVATLVAPAWRWRVMGTTGAVATKPPEARVAEGTGPSRL